VTVVNFQDEKTLLIKTTLESSKENNEETSSGTGTDYH
jgi:hypothetical protein